MKYAIKYNKQSKILDKIDELVIDYHKEDITLYSFMLKYSNKYFIINMNEEDYIPEIDKLKMIHEKNPELDFTIAIQNYNEIDMINYIKKCELKFCSQEYVYNWDVFNYLVSEGVSDIYIVEDLGFELDRVAEIAHNSNIRIRVFPNVAQSHCKNVPDTGKFFIRPEDTEIYNKYIDVFEFYGEPTFIDTIYKIYAIDKQWYGNLSEIIIGLSTSFDSMRLLPQFGETRAICERKCCKGKKCYMCNYMIDIANTFKDKDIIVEKK